MDEERRATCLAPLQLASKSLSSVETKLIELVAYDTYRHIDGWCDGEGGSAIETSEDVCVFVHVVIVMRNGSRRR